MKILSAIFSTALLTLPVSSVFAEQPDAKTTNEFFQDWKLNCVENVETRQCVVTQELRTDKGQTAAVVNLTYREQETIIEIALPLMVDLTSPLSVSVDATDVKNYPYNACNSQACFILLKDDEDLLTAFKKGVQAQMKAKTFSGQNIDMKISLKGFSIAFSELMLR
jgi:invasion protein IalB